MQEEIIRHLLGVDEKTIAEAEEKVRVSEAGWFQLRQDRKLADNRGFAASPEEVEKYRLNEADNETQSLVEQVRFMRNPPTKTYGYWAYREGHSSPIITTHHGDILAVVTRSTGYSMKAPHGGRSKRRSISAFGINGAFYYGTYYDSKRPYTVLIPHKAGLMSTISLQEQLLTYKFPIPLPRKAADGTPAKN